MNGMQAQLCRNDHADCLLRSGPASDAPFTTTIIKHGQGIKILGWEYSSGFLYVQADHGGDAPGWLRGSHIISKGGGVIYTPLMDPDWYEQQWCVRSNDCWIKVSHGDSPAIYELRNMGFKDREIANTNDHCPHIVPTLSLSTSIATTHYQPQPTTPQALDTFAIAFDQQLILNGESVVLDLW